MLARCEIAKKDKFEIEKGTHRFNSLFITLDGEYEYTAGKITKRVLPYQAVVFKKGTSFTKRVIHTIEYIVISPTQFEYDADTWLSFREYDRARLKNSVNHLKDEILSGAPEYVVELFLMTFSSLQVRNRPKHMIILY